MAKKHGHYCKVCGEYKSNESFSGSGHASHICKKCAALPAAQRSEEMVLTKLWNLPWQLSAQQRDWLKGLQNDSRPEVASTAKELYADRFPYAARNARKKQLHILHMEFSVCGEVIDEYGDVCCEDIQFALDQKEHTVTLHRENEAMQVTLTEKDMRKLLNVIVNNYEVFCWEDDYGFSNTADADDLFEDEWDAEFPDEEAPEEPEYEDSPSWTVSVRYTNGEAQEMRGYDDLPDRVNELALELLALFEDEFDMEDDESDSDPDVRQARLLMRSISQNRKNFNFGK